MLSLIIIIIYFKSRIKTFRMGS